MTGSSYMKPSIPMVRTRPATLYLTCSRFQYHNRVVGVRVRSLAHQWLVSGRLANPLIGFGVGSAGPILSTQAIDCCLHMAGESIVLRIFARNVMGFAFTFAI